MLSTLEMTGFNSLDQDQVMLHRNTYTGPTRLVLAFDIGTINSAVSYSILRQGHVPEIHQVARFSGQGPGWGDARVPSILYYDSSGNVKAIGSAALDRNIIEQAEAEAWTKAEWWKIRSYPAHLAPSPIKDDDIPPLPPGKSVVDVLTDFIKYLWRSTTTYIKQHHAESNWGSAKDSVEFVFTHPNGWTGQQQRQYHEAIERAGLVPSTPQGRSRVHMITEGEASLHHCVPKLLEQPSRREPQGIAIIDAGGGIVDLGMYSITLNPISCKEIAPAESCLQGSVFVSCRAAILLKRLLRQSPHSSTEEISELMREFDETTKRSISSADKLVRIKIGDSGYNNPQYNISRGHLELSGKDATGLFDDSFRSITAAFERQKEYASTHIDVAFLVGGFAANQWLWSELHSYFEIRGIELFRSDDDINKAAARGAVLSRIGFGPRLVTSRVERPTSALRHTPHVDIPQNSAIAELMGMTGLEQVKKQILRIKSMIDTMDRQGVTVRKERLNLVLIGNPGTGKTTVARLYAQFLMSMKALPGNIFLETTGAKLSSEGVKGAQKLIDNALKAGGGAIFIDEAYQLVTEYDMSGKQVLDFLLPEIENRVGRLVFILAGYDKKMEIFFEHNPGLRSRFPYELRFADYTDEELMSMLVDRVHKYYKGRMKVEDGVQGLYTRIAIKRLGRQRGTPKFANARALENLFAKIRGRQAERLEEERKTGTQVDDFMFTKEDLIGRDPSGVRRNSASWARLQKLIGLDSVKDSVRSLFTQLETNYQRELAEMEPLEVSLNKVFLGSPGTGKTSVAKLYGQILADLGMLSNGEVVVKKPADFIGAYVGHSEKNTKAILESTTGKVLVIDEAYDLYKTNETDPFRTAVINTIVGEVQNVPGEDRCVLLLGYKDQIEEMFRNANTGLSRRFSIDNAFVFEDFTEPQLIQILECKLKEQDLSATNEAKQVAGELLSRMKSRPNFGNAGDVENLLGQAKTRYQKRVASLPATNRVNVIFEPQDFDPDFDRGQRASANLANMFADIVGCDEVINKLDEYQKIARAMRESGKDIREKIPCNFVFKGPPGTGKTTVARMVGHVYYDMGFLATRDVVECSVTDLIGQFVGHTGPKTRDVFEKALGKVLFIDEAYRLSEGRFATEAMDEIVDLMTKERFKDKLVIILAGYEHEMNALLRLNTGLSSRFSEEIIFRSMSTVQCLKLLDKELQKDRIIIPELVDKTSSQYLRMEDIMDQMSLLPSWGNARDVKALGQRIVRQHWINVGSNNKSLLSVEDVVRIMAGMLQGSQGRQGTMPTSSYGSAPITRTNDSASSAQRTFISTSNSSERTNTSSSRSPPQAMLTPASRISESTLSVPSLPQKMTIPTSHISESIVSPSPSPSSPPQKVAPPTSRTSKSTLAPSPPVSSPSKQREQSSSRPSGSRPPTKAPTSQKQSSKPTVTRRDVGVSDAIWNQLKADIRTQEEARKAAAEEECRLKQELEEAEQNKQSVAARPPKAKRPDVVRLWEAEIQRLTTALRMKQDEEEKRVREEQEIQETLHRMGRCDVGHRWVRQDHGYRCEGGFYFVPHEQLTHRK